MKQLIIATIFAAFSLAVPLSMAQQHVENAAVESEQDDKAKSTTIKINVNSKEDGEGGETVVVNIDGEKLKHAERQIEHAVEKLADIFGDSLAAEFTLELDELSEREKEQLGEKIEELFDDNNFSISTGSDSMGPGEVLIALTAVSFTLGLPVIILLLVLIFRQRKRKQMLELADVYLKADRPMPAHVMAEFGSNTSNDTRLKKGLFLSIVGVAVTIVLFALNDIETATIGLIPIAIGISRLVFWKYENGKELKDEDAPLMLDDNS